MTDRKKFILVSPGALDGYPPVQYQARLLANAGHSVEIITSPLVENRDEFDFHHPGVQINSLSIAQTFGDKRLPRILGMVRHIFTARRRLGRGAIEIAYDPQGVFYSDITPYRPQNRVAHLHERIADNATFFEKRLRNSIRRYRAVTVPDVNRGIDIEESLSLNTHCKVVQNYPLRTSKPFLRAPTGRFEVVYAGSLGENQKLDLVIRSVKMWPKNAHLILLGDETRKSALKLAALAQAEAVSDRVHFLGWMKIYDAERRMANCDLAISLQASVVEKGRAILGASNKRFQYMKSGLPQIGDMSAGIKGLLLDNGIGACITSDEPEQISNLVHAYSVDKQRCRDEGDRAFALHQSKFNYEQVFQPLLEELETW